MTYKEITRLLFAFLNPSSTITIQNATPWATKTKLIKLVAGCSPSTVGQKKTSNVESNPSGGS